ncbi:hypothetical protein [Helicobacter sp. MIT 14-3879]|uniref:hypothetical protein n=1 Tax=Helicobacter sp. MIT 14-3879 TaxID=2040649 RepID=UPI000E1EBC25|nr:hypothetical protein [Helicobacter sp. MIT 14-3879]RDU65149.1 hypothetical protein CQA44_02215 [Helicobacter sp. MIT 14-3879]
MDTIKLKCDGKEFKLKLLNSSYEGEFKEYLSKVISKRTNGKLGKETQESYLTLLKKIIETELKPNYIATKNFNIYQVDDIKILECLLSEIKILIKEIKNKNIPLHKPNKTYKIGDVGTSLQHYIDFLNIKNRLSKL